MDNGISNDLQFHHGESYDDYSFYVDKSFPNYYALQFMSSGSVDVSYDGQLQHLSGSWVWPCYPGPRIRYEPGSSGSWKHHYIAFSGSRVQAWKAQGLWPREPQEIPDAQKLLTAMIEVIDLSKKDDYWSQRCAVHGLEGVLLQLAAQRSQSEQRYEAWLEDFLRRLHVYQHSHHSQQQQQAQKAHDINIQAIADSWGMSLSTFRRRFKKAIGSSVHDYIIDQRIQHAQKLLRESDDTIKSIVHQLGYNDVYFFSRQFKQRVGVSPGSYRIAGN